MADPDRKYFQERKEMNKNTVFTVLALSFTSVLAAPVSAQVVVGGAPMYASKDIIDNAVNSKEHTTLVAAVKAAGLVDTLKGPGPFTVFASVDAAFAALPAGTVDTPLKPENKPVLAEGADRPCRAGPARCGGAEDEGRRPRDDA